MKTNEEREAVLRFLKRKAEQASTRHREALGSNDTEESGLWSFARGMLDGTIEAIEHGDHLLSPGEPIEMERDAIYTRSELEEKIDHMRRISSGFYAQAVQTGVHPFIEFCGFMNEFIRLCEDALRDGIDFTQRTEHTGQPLPMQAHHARYIGEKFSCIFGPTFKASATLFRAFTSRVRAGS